MQLVEDQSEQLTGVLPKTYTMFADDLLRELLRIFNNKTIDEVGGRPAHADHYTPQDREHFEQYLQGQLAKITIPDKDEAFLRERMLTMYANPVRNYQAAL